MSPRGLTGALSMFTIFPVRSAPAVSRADGRRIMQWLPTLGLALGALSGLLVTGVAHEAPQARFVAAVLGVGALAALTRGLHLDGLADTADGLASHQPPGPALEIMRRSDIGPFGVLTLVFVLLLDVGAVVSMDAAVWKPTAALAAAAATGRMAALFAAHQRVPAARPGGFGAIVAGSIPSGAVAVQAVALLVVGGVLAKSVDADVRGWVIVQAAALALASLLVRHACRRLGGVTGDVFGAVIEGATAATLVGIAFV